MRILFITSKSPFPSLDGGAMATQALLEGFSNLGVKGHVFVLETYKHPFDASLVPSHISSQFTFQQATLATELHPFAALCSLLQNKSYNLSRFFKSEIAKQLIDCLTMNQFDLIHFESLYATVYAKPLREHTQLPFVYRAHNIESNIWFNLTKGINNPIKKWYVNILAAQLKNYEIKSLPLFSVIIPITNSDQKWFIDQGCRSKLHVLPFGINIHPTKRAYSAITKSVCFIGAMNWPPNIEGVEWFLEKVWPLVIEAEPMAQFYLAGRFMSESLKTVQFKNVHIVGEVQDQYAFMQKNQVFVVPLLSGSGMRIKLIEALAMGMAIVSTAKGAEGVTVQDQVHLRIANAAEDFAHAIIQLLQQPELADQLGKNGHLLVELKYDNLTNTKLLVAEYQKLLSAQL